MTRRVKSHEIKTVHHCSSLVTHLAPSLPAGFLTLLRGCFVYDQLIVDGGDAFD